MLGIFLELLENNCLGKLERLSGLGYIAQLNLSLLSSEEFDGAARVVFHLLDESYRSNVCDHLRKLHKRGHFGMENYIFRIHDVWLLELLILASLKHSRGLFKSNDKEWAVDKVRELVLYIISKVSIKRPESLRILMVLETILRKRKDVADRHCSLVIMKFAHFLAVSPIDHFKQYSHTFSKLILKNNHFVIDLDILPIRSIDTADILPYMDIKSTNLRIIANKVIKMFSNNVESRDGGFLYRLLVLGDFEQWKSSVWPLFYPVLNHLRFQGELYESLVKFFIPINTTAYKSNFFKFISSQEVGGYLKAIVLLETRRKGFYIEEFDESLLHMTNSDVSVKIVSTYHKKTMLPRPVELQVVKNYLELSPSPSLDVKSVSRFLSQIFLVSHRLLLDNNDNDSLQLIDCYKKFLDDIFTFCLSVLNTSLCDVGAQLLMIIWGIAAGSSDALSLGYKLDETFFYPATGNKLFQSIKGWTMYCERVRLSVKSSLKERPNCHLGKLIANRCYGIEIDAYNIEFLFTFIKNVENPSIESADILRSYAHIVSRNYSCSSAETINSLTQKVRENFAKPYSDTVVFEIVLLFEVLSEVSGHDLTNACLSYSIWEDSLVRICENLERPASASHDVIVSHKSQKIKEALINVILQFMLRVRYFPQFCNKEKIFRCLCAIIETSNMKRPTVLSAELINALASSMDGTETDKNLKITFLDRALRNIAQARSTQILSIRKNPAARLPVHALCVSDRRPGKPLLSWTVNQLLDILSDPNSSHSSIASALYCAEVLISDNTMYNSTLPHIPDFISHCVHLFLKPSWTVRNADLQLTKALIDRFYGVVIGSSLRPKTIEHLLLLFPQLASRFCNVLSGSLTDSCLIVMEFISEAHIRKPLFENSFFELTRGFLLRALFTIIETNSHDYGLMAVKAYAALCREDDVPSVFCGTVEYLIENLLLIRSQRTLRNFLYLLQGLYEKSRHKKRMNSRYRKLTVVARDHLDSRYVSFLSFKSSTLDEIETSVDRIDSSKYDSRIWQNNYLPYWLNNAEDEMLGYVLQKMLRSRVSDCVQSKLLSVLVAKYSKSCINDQVWRYVASALVSKVVEVDDSNIYLLLCYLKVVLLLKAYVTEISDDLLNNIRFSYESVNHHYKSFVYVIALASRRGLSISDQRFIKLSIKRLKNLNFDDEEVSELTSEILPSLYKCTWCSCTRLEVHKMALLLLLRHGLTDFIDFTSGSKQRSAVEAAATLLSCKNLLKCLGCRFEVLKFTEFVWNYTSLPNSGRSRKSNSYFTSRNETHVDEKLIHKMVFKLCVDLKSLNK